MGPFMSHSQPSCCHDNVLKFFYKVAALKLQQTFQTKCRRLVWALQLIGLLCVYRHWFHAVTLTASQILLTVTDTNINGPTVWSESKRGVKECVQVSYSFRPPLSLVLWRYYFTLSFFKSLILPPPYSSSIISRSFPPPFLSLTVCGGRAGWRWSANSFSLRQLCDKNTH